MILTEFMREQRKPLMVSIRLFASNIATLAAKGWSARKIARELGVHRETVAHYLHPKRVGPPDCHIGSSG